MHRCLIRRTFVFLMVWASWTSSLWADDNAETAAPKGSDAAAQQADELPKYELSHKFTLGQVVHLRSEYKARIAVKIKEASQVDKNTSTLWKHYTVTAVGEDGTGTLELQLDKAHQEAQFGDNPPEVFKSDDPKFHHRKFRDTLAMIGRPTARIDYSPKGKLLQVVQPNGDNKVAAPKRPPLDHQGFLIPLPAEPIAVGETWKDPFQQSVGIKGGLLRTIELLRVYELKSVDGDVAKISFKTGLLTPVNNEEILAQLATRLTAGNLTFDMRKGLIVDKLITVNESVINAFGQGTSMHAVTKLSESIVPAEVVAENEKPTATETN